MRGVMSIMNVELGKITLNIMTYWFKYKNDKAFFVGQVLFRILSVPCDISYSKE